MLWPSHCNIFVVIWKLGLAFTTSWNVSFSFCAIMSIAFVTQKIDYAPLFCSCTPCIHSNTCSMSANSFLLLSLWFSASSYSSVARSCTLFETKAASSSVIVYSGMSLWALAFLRGPPVCKIDHLGGPVSCRVFFVRVPCVVVVPLPCSSCKGTFSFFAIFPLLFGALPFFCCAVFGLGFDCCVGFLVAMLPPANVLDDPTSTSFPLGRSLVMTRIF
jgi:hypothetical protein